MCQVTQTAMRMKKPLKAQCLATNMAQYSRVSHKVLMDTILTRRGMALCLTKFDIYVPIFGWFISQSYSLWLLRSKNNAARSSRGVVGSTGTNAPSTPSPREMIPNMVNRIFISSEKDGKCTQ